ncbi:unnamed protein product [Durusdinium trenchii]|uniref:Uncharacterized protein n=1 Tax=Durusdinium trenchii TaxID=1381693 RepID=A0ABP0JY66_9DINO
MEARQHQARRVVEYHQNHIADHLLRCEGGEGNERPFRHTLSTSVEPPRRRRHDREDQEYLVETHVPPRPGPLSVKPRMVKPLVRLRRPGAFTQTPLGAAGALTARQPKRLLSPRLPPLVYEGIDRSLAGKRLPAAWFAEPLKMLTGPERSQSIQEPSADEV